MLALRRLLLGLLVLTILAAPVIAVLSGRVGGQHWPMKRLQVSAPFEFVSQDAIRKSVARHSTKGFFAVDLMAINRDLKALHWVERVEVRKQWPDTIIVQIQEYRPLAVWNGKQMLAEQGSVFAMPKTKLPLALLLAHRGDSADVMDRGLGVVNRTTLKRDLKLSRKLLACGIAEKVSSNRFSMFGDIKQLDRADPCQMTGGDIAHAIAAGLSGR